MVPHQQAKRYTAAKHGQALSEFLSAVIKRAGFKLEFELTEDPPHEDFENPDLLVKFSGPDTEILLANKGEVLLAFEQLAQEVLRMGGDEHALLCFDANDFRVMRVEELRLSALTAAEKVKKGRVPFRFGPMNSRERRIIHLALRNEPDVRSESDGAAPYRGVVIYPAGMSSQPGNAAKPSFTRRRRR